MRKNLFRHRSFIAEDLTDLKKKNRLTEELEHAANSEVWFSRVADQNDPFDTKPYFVDSSLPEVRSFLSEFWKMAGHEASFGSENIMESFRRNGIKKSKFRKLQRNFKKQIELARKTFDHIRDNQLISCFTEDPTNILMWSYYSNSHRSFCYEFSLHDDDLEVGSSKVADVRYLKQRPKITTLDTMKFMAAKNFPQHFGLAPEDDERVTNASLLSKSEHWMHEKEWRALKMPSNKKGFYSISPYKLQSVIFGALADPELVEFVRNEVPQAVNLKRCELHGAEYKLSLSSISD